MGCAARAVGKGWRAEGPALRTEATSRSPPQARLPARCAGLTGRPPKSTFGATFAVSGAWNSGYSSKLKTRGGDVRREAAARRVVSLHALVVAHPLDGDAVLRARQLVHQPRERLVRLQQRVVFDDDEQPGERRRLLVGGLNFLLRWSARRPAWRANRRWPGTRRAPAARSPWSSRPGSGSGRCGAGAGSRPAPIAP